MCWWHQWRENGSVVRSTFSHCDVSQSITTMTRSCRLNKDRTKGGCRHFNIPMASITFRLVSYKHHHGELENIPTLQNSWATSPPTEWSLRFDRRHRAAAILWHKLWPNQETLTRPLSGTFANFGFSCCPHARLGHATQLLCPTQINVLDPLVKQSVCLR